VANRSKARADAPALHLPNAAEPKPWALAPSDFAFLWDDCPRCFYQKVALGQSPPRAPFPSVFGRIDRAMKDHYLGKRAEGVAAGTPAGVIGRGDRWVKSAPPSSSGRQEHVPHSRQDRRPRRLRRRD